jgi:hypothetical protein
MKLLVGKYYNYPLGWLIHSNMSALYARKAASLFYCPVEHFFDKKNILTLY